MAQIVQSFYFFLLTIAYGFTGWSAYSVLNAVGELIFLPRLLRWITDPLYWSVAAVLTFRMMFQVEEGVLRGYGIFGLLLGMTISAAILRRRNRRRFQNERKRQKEQKKKKAARLPEA